MEIVFKADWPKETNWVEVEPGEVFLLEKDGYELWIKGRCKDHSIAVSLHSGGILKTSIYSDSVYVVECTLTYKYPKGD